MKGERRRNLALALALVVAVFALYGQTARHDFVSYDDRFPFELQLFQARLLRKDADIEGYEKEALAFLKEVDRDLISVRTLLEAAA